MILTDVFETFRSVSLTPGKFEVDPAHYVSAPQMAWDAMLKKTGMTLDLITDPAMYLMIEGGMRGGVCMISKRYAKANNKDMGALYNPNLPSKYILYLDANNLYGWPMSQYLPTAILNGSPKRSSERLIGRTYQQSALSVTSSNAISSTRPNSTHHITTIRWPPNACRSRWRCLAIHKSAFPDIMRKLERGGMFNLYPT